MKSIGSVKVTAIFAVMLFTGCGGSSSSSSNNLQTFEPSDARFSAPHDTAVETDTQITVDAQLQAVISKHRLTGDPSLGRTLPNIQEPLPQLGKLLFFSKSLSGEMDSACVSCHHPALAGTDKLSLPVGVKAINVDLLGPGRTHREGSPKVPRNAPTIFNVAMHDVNLFWDARIASLSGLVGENGAGANGIRTPDSAFGVRDEFAGVNLVAAQAAFPVTSAHEMRGDSFEQGNANQEVRDHLAARIGGYGIGANELAANSWLAEFQQAFASTQTAEELITYANIAQALGEYQRSMVFINNPWSRYVKGDSAAMSADQKAGAVLFYTPTSQGGAGCASCHAGDNFTDERQHLAAFPQIGQGKGDVNNDDFGAERESKQANERYRFKTPSLLNVALTAPYGHAGSYETLEQVIDHYEDPYTAVKNYFAAGGWCQLQQFAALQNCQALYPNAQANTDLALTILQQQRQANTTQFRNMDLTEAQHLQLIAFMHALTDDCAAARNCVAPWIADTTNNGPDGQQLNALDKNGNPL